MFLFVCVCVCVCVFVLQTNESCFLKSGEKCHTLVITIDIHWIAVCVCATELLKQE